MGVRLAKERGDFHHLRSEPKPLQEFKPTVFTEVYQKLEDEDNEYDSEED